MKLIGIMPARNEDWILGLSARAALMWCDELVILNHASDDETPRIINDLHDEHPERVTSLNIWEPVWAEMAHRQRLLDIARTRGATHIAIVDADEVLSGNLLQSIRPWINGLTEGRLLQLPWACLSGIDRYYSEGVWGTNWVTMAFHDIPSYGWQARGEEKYDFHHRHPVGSVHYNNTRQCSQGAGGLMHLQFSSRRRLRAKQALYKITEVLRWSGRRSVADVDEMYNLAVYDSDPLKTRTEPVPIDWWAPYAGLLMYLDVEREPWQEAEVRKAIAAFGRERFAGLDLFGVDAE